MLPFLPFLPLLPLLPLLPFASYLRLGLVLEVVDEVARVERRDGAHGDLGQHEAALEPHLEVLRHLDARALQPLDDAPRAQQPGQPHAAHGLRGILYRRARREKAGGGARRGENGGGVRAVVVIASPPPGGGVSSSGGGGDARFVARDLLPRARRDRGAATDTCCVARAVRHRERTRRVGGVLVLVLVLVSRDYLDGRLGLRDGEPRRGREVVEPAQLVSRSRSSPAGGGTTTVTRSSS